MTRRALVLGLLLTLTATPSLAAGRSDPLAELRALVAFSDNSVLPLDTANGARREVDTLIARRQATPRERLETLELATELLPRLLRDRIQPNGNAQDFTVWTAPDYAGQASGGNSLLRQDIAIFANDVVRLRDLFGRARGADSQRVITAQLDMLALIARYRAYIVARWPLGPTTAASFETAKATIARALIDADMQSSAVQASWEELADLNLPSPTRSIPPTRPAPAARPHAPARVAPPSRNRDNPFSAKVDAAISDLAVRRAIRAVQPAAVKIGGGSGVNLTATGLILTNAHVAKTVGKQFTVTFPDGRTVQGRAVAVDAFADLALVELDAHGEDLPTAPFSRTAPSVGTEVIIIGNPGTTTPEGQPTGYQRFHVSTGAIRQIANNPLASQSLGGTGHDAWTYWGHSGSPLFNTRGEIVALHNSWDSRTALRHAVTWQAISRFLDQNRTYLARR